MANSLNLPDDFFIPAILSLSVLMLRKAAILSMKFVLVLSLKKSSKLTSNLAVTYTELTSFTSIIHFFSAVKTNFKKKKKIINNDI